MDDAPGDSACRRQAVPLCFGVRDYFHIRPVDLMHLNNLRPLRLAACVVALAACASEGVLSPGKTAKPLSDIGQTSPTGGVVISQIYGGGGNSGATITNDFVELYNAGTTDVSLNGWSVQYASAAGTTWQVTSLSGTIPSGHYYLVQESKGAGGTTPLPTPDAIGTIAMSGTAGKVALVQGTTALSGCPTALTAIDYVGFGTSASCYEGSGPTATLSNTTAALRVNDGAQDTNDNSADFAKGPPNPRNTGIAPPPPGTPATVTVSPPAWSFKVGQSKTLIGQAADSAGASVSTTFKWTSSNTAVATIDSASGIATAVALGTTTITATTPNGITGTATLTVIAGSISVQPLDGPLPVGFQSQVFVTDGSTDASGTPVSSSGVTWSTADPLVATIDANTGIITAVSAGSVKITATANTDHTSSGSTTITTYVAEVSSSARVGHNTELGTPTDADPSNDVIVARRQYTLSYNPAHGGPNWVSWNLDASHEGSSSRCNCFTADTALTRLGYVAYNTNDWINGGVYSRGHMSPSADWADAPGDNAPTFFLSNMLPQNQTLNSGAWGALENYLRTVATGSTEIYIISGPIFTKNRSGPGVDGLGFMNSVGHIAVPDSIWKIAVIVNDARSADQITSAADVRILAVNMPNNASGTGTFDRYETTVDAIERSTGYDFLAMLPDSIEKIVEANDHAPTTTLAAQSATAVTLGQPISVVGTFVDADGRTDAPWSYKFDWGDGTSVKGTQLAYLPGVTKLARSKTYSTAGNYTVKFTLSDKYGATSTSELSITVQP
jgi:DNA/RNA endonuclease G (NUC1)